jgi:hypothetical protein
MATTIWAVPPMLAKYQRLSIHCGSAPETGAYNRNKAPNQVTQRGIKSDSKTGKTVSDRLSTQPYSYGTEVIHTTRLNPAANEKPKTPSKSTGFRPQRSDNIP